MECLTRWGVKPNRGYLTKKTFSSVFWISHRPGKPIPPKCGGGPQENTVKQGISDTAPPKIWQRICRPQILGGTRLQGALWAPWQKESKTGGKRPISVDLREGRPDTLCCTPSCGSPIARGLRSLKDRSPVAAKLRKCGGVQKSMGHKVAWKTGMLVCHPVTSRPLMFPQKEAVLSPCNFAITYLTAFLSFISLELHDP